MEENTTNIETTNNGTTSEKTYTESEVAELLQREGDRRVSEAMKKLEKKTNQRIEEALKKASMTEQQKFTYELEQREKAIEEKEKALAFAENKNYTINKLNEKGLNIDLANFLVADSTEDIDSNVDLLDKIFKASIKTEIEKRLNSSSPRVAQNENQGITRQQFLKMTTAELAQLKRTNPELYSSLKS